MFRYPLGEFKIYRDWQSDFPRVFSRLSRAKTLWTHWPPILLVFDADALPALPPALSDLPQQVFRVVRSTDIETIKGVDFQHAMLFLGRDTFEMLQKPFACSGQPRYHRLRLLRIPFSRARDSLSVFLLNPEA